MRAAAANLVPFFSTSLTMHSTPPGSTNAAYHEILSVLQDSTVVHLDSANETIRPVVDPKKWVFPNPAPRWIKLDEEAQHQQLSQRIKHDSGDHYGDDEADDGQGSDDGDAGSEEAVAGGGDLFIEGEEGSSSNGPGAVEERRRGQNSGGTSRGPRRRTRRTG